MVVESDSDSGDDGMLEGSDSDDSDYSQKSIKYLSVGEEELIQFRSRKSNKTEVLFEHDEFIGDLLKNLRGEGDDSDLQEPFIGVE